jgi:hypothetical protein
MSLTWRVSSRCAGTDDNCIAVADPGTGIVHIRDTADPAHATLTISAIAWTAFIQTCRQRPDQT